MSDGIRHLIRGGIYDLGKKALAGVSSPMLCHWRGGRNAPAYILNESVVDSTELVEPGAIKNPLRDHWEFFGLKLYVDPEIPRNEVRLVRDGELIASFVVGAA